MFCRRISQMNASLGWEGRNVGEVLFRSDAKIHATPASIVLQPRNDVLELQLIGHVFKSKGTAFLRIIRDHLPVDVVRNFPGKSISSTI